MHRFYAPGFALDHVVDLPSDEAHHLSRVMRLKAGDPIAVFDGESMHRFVWGDPKADEARLSLLTAFIAAAT